MWEMKGRARGEMGKGIGVFGLFFGGMFGRLGCVFSQQRVGVKMGFLMEWGIFCMWRWRNNGAIVIY